MLHRITELDEPSEDLSGQDRRAELLIRKVLKVDPHNIAFRKALEEVSIQPGSQELFQRTVKLAYSEYLKKRFYDRPIVSFRQACVKGDIGAGIRIIGAVMDGPCAWRGWSPCRL
jgi:hypothetical protein